MTKGKALGIGVAAAVLLLLMVIVFNRDAAKDDQVHPVAPPVVKQGTSALLGQPLTNDGVQVLASPLFEGKDSFGDPRVCSTVEYQNKGSDSTRLSMFDWKLQTPDGVAINPTIGGTDNDLPYGDIIPGGRASGDICFDEAFAEEGFVLIYEPSLWSDGLTWSQS